MIDKTQLRQYYKRKRAKLENKEEKDRRILNRLKGSLLYSQCETVFLYASTSLEIDTFPLIACALKEKKTVALPICDTNSCTVTFHQIKSFDDLHCGAYGIFEPKEGCKQVLPDENTLLIVPGLAFTKFGFRLGFGKGYYDRYLSHYNGKSVGLCYDECMGEDLATQNHDKSVNEVITEYKIYFAR